LTHSLEVAQIARSIVVRLNATQEFLRHPARALEPDIAEIAALCHDLGHPPFGHNGEKALDECMKPSGGFEGNAQTLRILARLEKRENPKEHPDGFDFRGGDRRCGLNLTARVLASVLKYDNRIPLRRNKRDRVRKGYYRSESDVVAWFKERVVSNKTAAGFKTVECQIMDVADDIAYSTYDLEDALKAGFLIPLDLATAREDLLDEVRGEVARAVGIPRLSRREIRQVLADTIGGIGGTIDLRKDASTDPYLGLRIGSVVYDASLQAARDGHLRVGLTSGLVGKFLAGVRFEPNESVPPLSRVFLSEDAAIQVEALKHFTFAALIMSPRLKVAEYRGGEIVKTIFEALADHGRDGYRLLPDDFQSVYGRVRKNERERVICDFIAGMTDRYALEFYGRLKSESPQTIFKPL
jgi:dGTPase